MKAAVIYGSKYGSTKQYASWIAEALGAELMDREKVKKEQLSGYDIVIYGGGLYASGITGVDLVIKNPCRNLVIFTVGLAAPEHTDYTAIINKNIPEKIQREVKIFHLRGAMDYSELNMVHRGMMAMMKKMVAGNKRGKELTQEERTFLDTYGHKVSFIDRGSVQPIVDYVNGIGL